MKRADPEKDMTRNTHNYFAHGGSATVEGGDDLFGQSEPAAQIAYIADSEATTIAALKDDFNGLLAALRNAGLMASGQ